LVRVVIVPFTVSLQSSNGNNLVTLSWYAVIGKTYQVQWMDVMNSTGWSNLGAPFTATNSAASQTDNTAGFAPQKFYRVIITQ